MHEYKISGKSWLCRRKKYNVGDRLGLEWIPISFIEPEDYDRVLDTIKSLEEQVENGTFMGFEVMDYNPYARNLCVIISPRIPVDHIELNLCQHG